MLQVKHCWQRLYLPCFLTISKKLERVADSNVATRCDHGIETALIASFVAHTFEILVEKPIVVLPFLLLVMVHILRRHRAIQ